MYKIKLLFRKVIRTAFPGLEFQRISNDEATKIVVGREPPGKFWFCVDGDCLYYGLDNADGKAYVEAFSSKRECFRWLNNKLAVDYMGHLHEY